MAEVKKEQRLQKKFKS